MKHLLPAFIIFCFFSCKSEEKNEPLYQQSNDATVAEGAEADLSAEAQLGREIFDGKGNCYSCHKPDQKVIGPSIREIATVYKDKKADMVKFLREEAPPVVDPEQYPVMKSNLVLTKSYTDEELKALEAYFYSFQ